jgi:uncharacterized protein YdeI (YjbR/CyaY-like superfamily)
MAGRGVGHNGCRMPAVSSSRSFQATLERMASRLNWVVVRVPFEVSKVWGTRGQLKVKGDINGFPFRGSLFAAGGGAHFLPVNKRMQAGGKAGVGEAARFRVEPDLEVRTAAIPPELARILSGEPELLGWYHGLNYSTRHDIANWIEEVKSPEARERRAMQLAERLLAAMEAEAELPPVIRMAFAPDPRARRGWELMSPLRRRGHLLGIFYYREPAAQARRIAKAAREAVELAEKAEKKRRV